MNELFKYNSSKQEYLLNTINEYLEMEEAVNINTETKEVVVCE